MLRFKVCVPYRSDSQGDWDEVSSGQLIVWVGETSEAITVEVPKSLREGSDPTRRLVVDHGFVAPRGTLITLKFLEMDDQGMRWTIRECTQALTAAGPAVSGDWFGIFGVKTVRAAMRPTIQAGER